jgi:hypothetical protein
MFNARAVYKLLPAYENVMCLLLLTFTLPYVQRDGENAYKPISVCDGHRVQLKMLKELYEEVSVSGIVKLVAF